jgi:hypothetical protein
MKSFILYDVIYPLVIVWCIYVEAVFKNGIFKKQCDKFWFDKGKIIAYYVSDLSNHVEVRVLMIYRSANFCNLSRLIVLKSEFLHRV